MVVEQRAHSFEDMTNVSKQTRLYAESNFVINHIKVDTMQREDDTVKTRHCMMVWWSNRFDPTNTRTTACVSSQVGCS
jgi:23S rRNA (adenine2503-C2)-methyltransferase